MYDILFNPLSNNGACLKQLEKLEEYLKKANEEFQSFDLVELSKDINGFISKLNEKDKLIILGGDGTLHRFINASRGIDLKNEIFLYKAGTGNDFSREFKKQKLINITKYLKNTPSFSFNNNHNELFLDCSGFGVDGEVCSLVNNSHESKKGIHYYKNALKTFKNFKRFELEAYVDGVRHSYKNVWFTTLMNGKYFGGGMKLAPDSDRTDDVMELYVIHSVPMWKLLLIFPLIFIGKVMLFKKVGISKISGKNFELFASKELVFQSDGEVTEGIKYFKSSI